jgi:hypothetical protein
MKRQTKKRNESKSRNREDLETIPKYSEEIVHKRERPKC